MEKVSVVRCDSYNNEEVKKALEESLRNIDFSFKKNIKVLIKPNILSPHPPEKAITTHPVIIEELCKILKRYNAKIYIGESSSYDTDLGFKISKIGKLAKYGKIINFEKEEKEFFNITNKKILLPKILFNVDLVINVPKLKTHASTLVTLCVKNLYGCIPGKLKENLHKLLTSQKKFSKFLFKLHEKIKPQLNIVDGVVGIEGLGPATQGKPIESKVIITGRNALATDIIASEIMGFNPYAVLTNKFSHIKRKNIKVIGNSNIRLNFKKPISTIIPVIPVLYFINSLLPKPKIKFNRKRCLKCRLCEKKCPVKVLSLHPYPECNYRECIRCLCCMEVCPNSAISLEDHWTKEAARKIYRKFLKS